MDRVVFIESFLESTLLEDLTKDQLRKVYSLAQDNSVFDNWFKNDPNKIDDNRVAIKVPKNLRAVSTAKLKMLKDSLEAGGADDIDWLKGTCKFRKRIVRIGKILEQAKSASLKNPIVLGFLRNEPSFHRELSKCRDMMLTKESDPKIDLSQEEKEISARISKDHTFKAELGFFTRVFTDRPIVGAQDYYVVISNHPVDIARMSEGRKYGENKGWDSCTDPNRYHKVWYELMTGGFVAYLVPPATNTSHWIDKEQGIRSWPVAKARMAIRKVLKLHPDTRELIISAVPEAGRHGYDPAESVYGFDFSGSMADVVYDWLASKGNIEIDFDDPSSAGKVVGGFEWSDTLASGRRKKIEVIKIGPSDYLDFTKSADTLDIDELFDNLPHELAADILHVSRDPFIKYCMSLDNLPLVSMNFHIVSPGKIFREYEIKYAPDMGSAFNSFVDLWTTPTNRASDIKRVIVEFISICRKIQRVIYNIKRGKLPESMANAIIRIPEHYIRQSIHSWTKGISGRPDQMKVAMTVQAHSIQPRPSGEHEDYGGDDIGDFHYFVVEEGTLLDDDGSTLTQIVAKPFIAMSQRAFDIYTAEDAE